MSTVKQAGFVAALIGICLIAVFSFSALHAESEKEMLILIVVGLVAMVTAAKIGFTSRAQASAVANPNLSAGFGALVFIAMIFLFRSDHFALLQIATVLLYCVVCIGVNLQIGYCGVMNFAGAAFFGVGAYTAAVLSTKTNVPHVFILLAGGVASAVLGSLLLLPVLRTKGHYAALVTIAFGTLFRSFLEVNDTLGGPQGLSVPGMNIFGWKLSEGFTLFESEFSFYINYVLLALVLFVGAFVLVQRLNKSWIGISLDAVRIDETAASAFGIHIVRWKITAFVIGNVLAGVAGAFFALMTGYVAPASFTFGDSLILLSIIVLGGIGNLWGIVPAAAIVILLPEKLQAIQEYRFLFYAIAVIFIILFRPQGMFPRRLRTFMLQWKGLK